MVEEWGEYGTLDRNNIRAERTWNSKTTSIERIQVAKDRRRLRGCNRMITTYG